MFAASDALFLWWNDEMHDKIMKLWNDEMIKRWDDDDDEMKW